MIKNPKFDLRYQYRRVLEASAVIALLCIIITLMVFKKFEVTISMRGMDAPAIEVEDIPITRTIKKMEVPRKPTIPIEDPDIDMAEDIELPDLEDFFDPDLAPPPPPPPPDEEVIPFFKVEQKPLLDGGNAAIAAYIVKHDLFPKMAREAGVSGKVMIEFVVDRDGATREVKAVQERPPGLGFGEAGVKVMKAMRFKPGMQRDRPVSVRMQQPISFTME
jgi:periplasmic protein TonB